MQLDPMRSGGDSRTSTQAMHAAFRRVWTERIERRARPAVIYHYCNRQALDGILKSRTIWATDVLTMKDRSEIAYGLDLAARVVKQRRNGQPVYLYKRILTERVAETWNQWCTHISCFSTSSEIQHQWEQYGDSHRGFALGFDVERLISRCLELGVSLFPVLYDQEKQCGALRHFLGEATEISRLYHLAGASLDEYCKDTMVRIASFVSAFKNPTYADEAEWRVLVVQTPDQGRFEARSRTDGRCYFALPLCSQDTLKAVVMGRDCPLEPGSLRELLAGAQWPDVSVSREPGK